MSKKVIGFAAVLIIAVAGLYYIGSGFIPRTDMALGDFSVSKDGNSMTIETGVMSSMGYARTCKATYEDEKAYLKFFSTFGGLNSSFGAKNRFTITLPEACTRIYFDQGEKKNLVLEKHIDTGDWEKVTSE